MGMSMDWTLEVSMVHGWTFFATLISRRSGHTPFVQTGEETSDTSVEAVEPDPRCFWQGYCRGWVGCESMGSRSAFQLLRIPSVIHPGYRTYVVVVRWTDELLCSVYKWVYRFEMSCIHIKMSRIHGAACYRESLECGSFATELSRLDAARVWRLSSNAGRRHPVTVPKTSVVAGSMRCVLEHCGTRQEHITQLLNEPGLRWLFTTSLLQHPSQSQQAALRVRRVMPAFCKVTLGVGDTWVSCSMIFRSMWARSKMAGFVVVC